MYTSEHKNFFLNNLTVILTTHNSRYNFIFRALDNYEKEYGNYNLQIIISDSGDAKKSEKIEQNHIDKYKIEIIEKSFLPHNEYIKYVKDCDVFVSPRKQEGIGMGFLEAISMGKYIISNDDSTMNEYILDEKIGFLINNNKLINYNNIINHNNYRMLFAKNGYLEWKNKKNEILTFFKKKLTFVKKNLFIEILFLLDLIKHYLKNKLK